MREALTLLQTISECLDALGDSALRVSCGVERLSGGSGWRGYLYPSSGAGRIAACGSRPARSPG